MVIMIVSNVNVCIYVYSEICFTIPRYDLIIIIT